MILKIVPYLFISAGIAGLFVSQETLNALPQKASFFASLVFAILKLPVWGKILLVIISVFWIGVEEKQKKRIKENNL